MCQIPMPAGKIAEANTYAAHAFICQSSMDGLALVHDGCCTTTEGVSIRLRAHHFCKDLMSVAAVNYVGEFKRTNKTNRVDEDRTMSKRKEVLLHCIVGPAARAQSTSKVGNIGGGTRASNFAT